MDVLQTKMVQHIRKKHPEFAPLTSTIQAPVTTAVISSAPTVISADGTTAEAVVVRKDTCHFQTYTEYKKIHLTKLKML